MKGEKGRRGGEISTLIEEELISHTAEEEKEVS